MSERAEVERAISLYFEAVNANDSSIIPLADNVVMSGPMMPEPINGVAAVRQYINETAPFMARMEQKLTVIEGENKRRGDRWCRILPCKKWIDLSSPGIF